MRLDGHLIIGTVLMFAGDLQALLAQLDQGIGAFEAPTYRARRLRMGTDPRVSCLAASAFILWMLGYPDRAVERSNRGVAIARDADPFSLAYGLFHSGFLHLWRSEPVQVAERAGQLIETATDHDFPIWRAVGTVLAGAANTFMGRPAEGLAQIGEGMSQYQGMRSPPIFWPFLRAVQAASLAGAGQLTEALSDRRRAARGHADQAAAALFHPLRGDLRLALGGRARLGRGVVPPEPRHGAADGGDDGRAPGGDAPPPAPPGTRREGRRCRAPGRLRPVHRGLRDSRPQSRRRSCWPDRGIAGLILVPLPLTDGP